MPKKRQPPRQFFRQWREAQGLTQDRALERLNGWSQSKLSRIESGRTTWNAFDLEDLSFAYGVSTWALLNLDPTKEGEVVDLMRYIERADDAARRELADFAAFRASRQKQG